MSTEIEGIKFYTIAELSALLKVTPQTIRTYIKQGKLKGQRVGRPTLVTERSLHNFLGVETEVK
jgi:excisionase family DNA binding protein